MTRPDVLNAVTAAPPATDECDPLTGLCSRAALDRLLRAAMVGARPGGTLPALLALDLDRFQAINDSTGIATGDGVLSRVARRIQGAVPRDATVARISGDEFAVLLPDGSQGGAVAAKLLELISRPYAVNGHAMSLSVSIGVAQAREGDRGADALLQCANIALHRAEADGKNHWCAFEPWMQERASSRQALEMDLRAALAVNRVELRKAMAVEQFEVHYQPQVDAQSLRPLGFEALARWRHPVRGMVGPEPVHSAGRGDRPDRPARRLGAAHRLQGRGPLARAVHRQALPGGRQRVADATARTSGAGRQHRRRARRVGPRARATRDRDHRERPDRRCAGNPAEHQGAGREPVAGRLRNRLFVAEPARALPLRPTEDRPLVRPRSPDGRRGPSGGRTAGPVDAAGHRLAGCRPGHVHRGRGAWRPRPRPIWSARRASPSSRAISSHAPRRRPTWSR